MSGWAVAIALVRAVVALQANLIEVIETASLLTTLCPPREEKGCPRTSVNRSPSSR